MKTSMPRQNPSIKTAPAGAVFGNSLQERLLLGDICRGRRGLRHEIFVLDGLAALDDGDRQELAALHGEDGHFGVFAVAFFIERNPARRACEIDFLQNGQLFRRVGRLGFLHRLDQQVCGVVREGCVEDRVDIEALLVGVKEFFRGRLRRDSRLRAQQALGATSGELTHFVGAGAVTEGEHRLDTELLALLEQGTGGGIHSAVEHRIRATALQLREDRLPVHRLVCALLSRQHFHSGGLERLFDFVCQTFAIGGRIVNDRHNLWLGIGDQIIRDRRALLVVATDHAENTLETPLCKFRIGGGAGDHRDIRAVIDVGRRNRGARIEVTDDACDFRVHQLLRHGIANLGVFLIVLCQQFEHGFLAVDPDFRRVRLFHRKPRPVLVVLAQVSDAPGKRGHASDGDADRGFCRGLGLLVFAATGNDRHGCDRDDAEFGADHGYLRIKTPRNRSPDYADPPRGCQFAEAAVRRDEPAGPWQQKGPAPAPALARREPAYFTVRMYFARVLASSSATVPLGGMGMAPHTPVEPSLIFFARYASASLRDLYLAATSLYAGPTSFLSRVWQLRHAFSFSSCSASAARAAPLQSETAAAIRTMGFMNSPGEVKNPAPCYWIFSALET